MEDTSTYIAERRLGSTLRLDNNETVASCMTTDSRVSSTSSHNRRNLKALSSSSPVAAAAALFPPERCQESTVSRFDFDRRSRRNSLGATNQYGQLDTKDEAGEGGREREFVQDSELPSPSVASLMPSSSSGRLVNAHPPRRRRQPEMKSPSGQKLDEVDISRDEQQNILLLAYDNARLPTHKPKLYATQEINVSDYQDVVHDADEVSSLPEDYLLDEYGNRYHPSKMDELRERLLSEATRPRKNDVITLLSSSESHGMSTSLIEKKRLWLSLVTILAAATLAIVGIVLSIRSVASLESSDQEEWLPYQYGYHFGGVLGGLLSWGREQDEQPLASNHDAGCVIGGPRCRQQWTSGGSSELAVPLLTRGGWLTKSHRSSPVAVLTSTPLRSYIPPLDRYDGIGGVTPNVNPTLDDAYIDLSILPYNPRLELPVVWNVPLSDGGGSIELVFGNCLKLVQCSGRGHEILSREHELENGGGMDVDRGTRSMMTVVPKIHLTQYPPLFNPPLRTEVVYTSTYVNVDCTTPEGVDRGVARDLTTSGMSDVIHSPDIYDGARLFSPPSLSTSSKTFGRAMVILRNPIEMSVARYERWKTLERNQYCTRHWARGDKICDLHWRHPREVVKDMSLEEFAKSDYLEDNIFTRTLVNKRNNDHILGANDLAKAKEILSSKFIIGIFDSLEDSLERFETFFDWNHGSDSINKMHNTCRHGVVNRTMARQYNLNAVIPENLSTAYMALAEKNAIDLLLYEYGRFLYDYQGRVLFGVIT